MNLILVNPQSNQQIPLDNENPLIIGRNNVVGCFDKKVSRSHGRITCTDNGKINLVALHRNPCFFMKNGVPPILQLNKDEEETLNEGDCLGLLPNSYWFQISSKNVTVNKEASSELCKNSETPNLENIKENKVNNSETQHGELCKTGTLDYSKRIGSPEFEKTRRLPLSMYETDELEVSDKSSSAKDSDKKNKKLKPNDAGDANSNLNEKNSETDKEDQNREKPSTSRNCADEALANDDKTKEKTDIPADKEAVREIKTDKTMKRPICQYEHNCFRKNPLHKMKFSHPGDSDYVAYEKRPPPCRYGKAGCRRNTSRRAEVRHLSPGSRNSSSDTRTHRPPGSIASSPLPLKRRRKKLKRDSECEDEDEDDQEDPFVTDASSDEYLPSDLNSEEDLDEPEEIE